MDRFNVCVIAFVCGSGRDGGWVWCGYVLGWEKGGCARMCVSLSTISPRDVTRPHGKPIRYVKLLSAMCKIVSHLLEQSRKLLTYNQNVKKNVSRHQKMMSLLQKQMIVYSQDDILSALNHY